MSVDRASAPAGGKVAAANQVCELLCPIRVEYCCVIIIAYKTHLAKCAGECLNGGQCVNGVCRCLSGWSGNFCEQCEPDLYKDNLHSIEDIII